jgi:hypothetical protein
VGAPSGGRPCGVERLDGCLDEKGHGSEFTPCASAKPDYYPSYAFDLHARSHPRR